MVSDVRCSFANRYQRITAWSFTEHVGKNYYSSIVLRTEIKGGPQQSAVSGSSISYESATTTICMHALPGLFFRSHGTAHLKDPRIHAQVEQSCGSSLDLVRLVHHPEA